MNFRRLAILVLAARAFAVELPALISDRMVLQRDAPVRLWGKAQPGEEVRASLVSQTVTTRAGADGKWQLFLQPLKAGGPHDLTINDTTIKDVMVGEVWVASGQSNMEWPVSRSKDADREIAESSYPTIRFFQVKNVIADVPAEDVEASWQTCSPEQTGRFSAVAYFFARDLQRRLRVPIGILQSDWGGTPAQAWTSRPGLEADPLLRPYLDRPLPKPDSPHKPTGLYNAMIAPLTPYAIRGAIWYQGESNAGKADNELYRRLFPAMIQDWRRAWAQGDFPFLFVQLANYAKAAEGTWPVLRESQTMTLSLRNTAMAVTVDVGESGDIHPKDKQSVGSRLALAARAVAYGDDIVHSGPLFRQAAAEGNCLRLWFDHVGSGLRARGGELAGFEIAGPDGNYVAARATIEGGAVRVCGANLSHAAAARYAWSNDPLEANLMNAEGLPASPFRTRP